LNEIALRNMSNQGIRKRLLAGFPTGLQGWTKICLYITVDEKT